MVAEVTRWVTTSVALCHDSTYNVVIKVVRAVDDQGRQWEQYDDGPWVPVEPPPEQANGATPPADTSGNT